MDTASIRIYKRNSHINTNNTLFILHIKTMLAQFVNAFAVAVSSVNTIRTMS